MRALEPDANLKPFPHFPKNVVLISIPVEVTGLSALDHATLKSLGFELVTTMGLHFSQPTRRTGAKPNFTSLYGFITSTGGDSPSYHLILNMEQSLYDRVATLPVKLKGQLAAEVHRNAMPTALKIDARTDVPNFGKCAVSRVSARTYQDEMLRVACESPNSFPQTQMVLTDTSTGRSRDEPLGGAVTRVSYPTSTWLSSINLREAFFHLTTQADSEWKLPLAILNHYRLEVEPQPSVGKVVADYELAGIDLRRYTPAGR